MNALYQKLGMRDATRGFSTGAIADPAATFERRLRDIETGAAALNLSSDTVHLAAEIAAFEPDLSDDDRIALILLIVISLAALEEGSTRCPAAGPESVQPMRQRLAPLCGESFGADGVERMRVAIERLLTANVAAGVIGTDANEYKPLIFLAPFIYQHRILAAEISLARRLAALVKAPAAQLGEPMQLRFELTPISATAGGRRFDLSEEQRAAIRCAVAAPLTIISGGPGTGKTSIVLAILKDLVSAGVDPKEIALAAPTGKAAYRIGESIRENLSDASDDAAWRACPDPATIHRLLGYSPTRRRYRHHRNNPLEARVVLVDEGSMLDLELMSRLLDAMRPDARLVILGDAEQLPSVSAGAVFRDLLAPAGATNAPLARNCVRLTHSYRTGGSESGGGAIFNLARAINSGDPNLLFPAEGARTELLHRRAAAQLELAGAEWLDDAGGRATFLEKWYADRIRVSDGNEKVEDRIFDSVEDGFAPPECESLRRVFSYAARSRILCVTRVLDSGSERINSLLHRRVAHARHVSPERDKFLVGEPVMVLKNDYERMLFNGDQGLVLRVRHADSEAVPMAVFPRGDNFVAFRVDALGEHLELCYAMTVHKAQGSEFDSIAVIMPDQDIPILSREILYTAVSRARRSVTIVGSKEVIQAGLARKIERYSGVREHLERCLNESQ